MLFHAQTSVLKTLAVITIETTFLLAISELINCTYIVILNLKTQMP